MPIFNEVTSFLVSPEVVRQALAAEVFPARLVERLDRNIAIARLNDRLHVFRWSSKDERMTVLYYEIDVDQPGVMRHILDGGDDYKGPKAEVTDAEAAEAMARLTRLESTIADTRFKPVQALTPPGYAPIGMRALFVTSLLLGVGGVFVAAINWNRMGYPRRFLPTLVLGTVLYSILAVLTWTSAAAVTDSSLLQFAVALPLGAILGGLLVACQQPAFHRWVAEYGPPAPKDQHFGCGFTFMLVASSLVALFIVSSVFVSLTGRTLENLLSKQVTVSGVSLTYPASWTSNDPQVVDQFGCYNELMADCVLTLNSGGDRFLVVKRYRQLTAMNTVVDSAFAMTAMRLALGLNGATLKPAVGVKIGGKPALRQTATTFIGTQIAAVELIYVQETPYSYVFIIGLSAANSGDIDPSIDKVIDTLQFAGPPSV